MWRNLSRMVGSVIDLLRSLVNQASGVDRAKATAITEELERGLEEERRLLREMYLFPQGKDVAGHIVLAGKTVDRFSDLMCDE